VHMREVIGLKHFAVMIQQRSHTIVLLQTI